MGDNFDYGDGIFIQFDWHQRHVVHVFSALPSVCLVYGALVVAVLGVVLALPRMR